MQGSYSEKEFEKQRDNKKSALAAKKALFEKYQKHHLTDQSKTLSPASKSPSKNEKIYIRYRKDKTKVKKLTQKVETLSQKNTHLQMQRIDNRKTIAQLRKQITLLTDQGAAQQNQFLQLENRLTSEKQSRSEKASQLLELSQQLKEMRSKLTRAKNQRQSVKHALNVLIRSSQGQALKRLQHANQQADDQNKSLSNTINKLGSRIQSLHEELKIKSQLLNSSPRPNSSSLGQAPTGQLIDELYRRMDHEPITNYQPIFGLYHRFFYRFESEVHTTAQLEVVDPANLPSRSRFYGFLEESDDQTNFVSINGTVFPDPVIPARYPINFDDAYRGQYDVDQDTFTIDNHYTVPANNDQTFSPIHHSKKSPTSKTGLASILLPNHPDAIDILTDKTIKVVSWFKQATFASLFRYYGVNIEVLNPGEIDGDKIFNELEKQDTDLAFVLKHASHHINTQIYKDRQSSHPDKIRIMYDASPKELLIESYDHFKSLATRDK